MSTADLKLDFFSQELQKAYLRCRVFGVAFGLLTSVSAAGLSAISGLNVISEKKASKSASNGNPITLRELFYIQKWWG